MPRRAEDGQPKKRAQMTVVFPEPQDMARLEAVARRKRLPASILVRMWVMEQVERADGGTDAPSPTDEEHHDG